MALLAILDDDPRRIEAMADALVALGLEAVYFNNAPWMIEWLGTNLKTVSLISLDHDLGPNWKEPHGEFNPGDGRDVANWLAERPPQCPILVHSANWAPAEGMLFQLQRAGWIASKVFPFQDLEWIAADWIMKVADLLGAGNVTEPKDAPS